MKAPVTFGTSLEGGGRGEAGAELPTGQITIQQFQRSGLRGDLGTNQPDPFRAWG